MQHSSPTAPRARTGQREATDWVESELRAYGFDVERQTFSAEIPGIGTRQLVNLVAVAPPTGPENTQSEHAVVVLAHRDNVGRSPGADDNGSGTGALLELARDLGSASLSHPIVLVSTDGGAYGGARRGRIRREPQVRRDGSRRSSTSTGSASRASPRIEFAGDTSRVPSPTLLATADASVEAQTGAAPDRPGRSRSSSTWRSRSASTSRRPSSRAASRP